MLMNPNDMVKFIEEDDETMDSVVGNSSMTEHRCDSNAELQQTTAQVLDHDAKPDKEKQMNKLQLTSHDQILPTGNGNPKTMTSSSSQQSGAMSKFGKISVGTLLPVLQAQLDKDRAVELNALHSKLMKNEISNDDFFRDMRSIAGDEMLKLAVLKLQRQVARNSDAPNEVQSQPQPSGSQLQVPSSGANPSGSERVASETTANVQLSSNSISDNNAAKSREVGRHSDSHGAQVGQMSTSISGSLSRERNYPAFPAQTSFPTKYKSTSSGYPPFLRTSTPSSAAVRPRPHDSQMRLAHPNLAINRLRPISTCDRPKSLSDLKKIPPGNSAHVQWPSSTVKEHMTTISPSVTHVKKNSHNQSKGQQRYQLSRLPPAPSKPSRSAFGSARLTPPTPRVPASSVSPSLNLIESNIQSSSQMPSLRANVGRGYSTKALPNKPLVGQKKLVKVPGPSTPSSKKQKVSGSFDDQSIEQLNDVTSVSGVNIKEEEEQLLSISKKDIQVSEAIRRMVQEEEERQILQKIPLQKLMMEIMARCGLKNISDDAQHCLSLMAEEKMRGLVSNFIKLSNQVHKKEDDKMRATDANFGARATTAVGDFASRSQLLVEVKQEKEEYDTSTDPQTSKDGGQQKPSGITEGNTRENQEYSGKRDPPVALTTRALIGKVGRNEVGVPRVTRSISVKDVIGVLEMEPQMSKSALLLSED